VNDLWVLVAAVPGLLLFLAVVLAVVLGNAL
jgi:hypothetical protein